MFDSYDRINIINLPERTDRRAEMERELARIGLASDPRVQFFRAIRPETVGHFRQIGEHGVFLSHLAILEGGGSVLILEDDCDFTRAVRKGRSPSDVLWGGYTARERSIEGAHCMGFSAEAVKLLVPYLRVLLAKPDCPPIDGAYAHFCSDHPKLVVDACDPPIAVQRPSDSDITPRPSAKLLRSIKRPLKRLLTRSGGFEDVRAKLRRPGAVDGQH
jgi:glycosyl transferase family 25